MAQLSETMSDVHIGTFDPQLHDNYHSTDYFCQNFRIQPGVQPPEFQDFLQQNGWQSYAFITAWNPFSAQQLSLVENRKAHQYLIKVLNTNHLTFLPALAIDPTETWPTEEGVFLFDVSLKEMIELGRQFGQNAVLYGAAHGIPEILWCHRNLLTSSTDQ